MMFKQVLFDDFDSMSSLILSITKQLMKFNIDIDFSEMFINMSILLIEAKCPLVGRNIQQLKNRYLQEFQNTITCIYLKKTLSGWGCSLYKTHTQ